MKRAPIVLAIAGLLLAGAVSASSHREAPLITGTPKVDGTDFYMFRSYEAGRDGYVTFIANYDPLQNPGAGPNYYSLDPTAIYSIKVDNTGSGSPAIIYQFHFKNVDQNLSVNVGGQNVPVPLVNIGQFGTTPTANDNIKNVIESYTVSMISSPGAAPVLATNLTSGGTLFRKPFDNIGNKSMPNYGAYADSHIFNIGLPGCGTGRVFVGQRRDPFVVALGQVFDLLDLNPLGPVNGNHNSLSPYGITTIALEVPIACVTAGGSPVIGAWTTAELPNPSTGTGPLTYHQVSRLGMPLVNELVIGLPDKDKFNASAPSDDAQFAKYVTNPSLPALIQALFPSVKAPTLFPRTDLVAVFLTGVKGLNQQATVRNAEELRLNTSLPAETAANQNNLGVLGGDTSGFPNGRRPGDDVVDIELRAAMGALLPSSQAPSGQMPFTDGASTSATYFQNKFPYLNTPLPGASTSTSTDARGTTH